MDAYKLKFKTIEQGFPGLSRVSYLAQVELDIRFLGSKGVCPGTFRLGAMNCPGAARKGLMGPVNRLMRAPRPSQLLRTQVLPRDAPVWCGL